MLLAVIDCLKHRFHGKIIFSGDLGGGQRLLTDSFAVENLGADSAVDEKLAVI
jgi:hypothetical protein